MKLELDVWRHLLGVYTRFQINMSKYVEQNSEILGKKTAQK